MTCDMEYSYEGNILLTFSLMYVDHLAFWHKFSLLKVQLDVRILVSHPPILGLLPSLHDLVGF